MTATSSAPEPAEKPERVWLCLSGGNALGAYQTGSYQALHENGVEPLCIAGASVGAVTGAIIAGNPREKRLERLHEFWSLAGHGVRDWALLPELRYQRQMAALQTLLAGRPGLFHPALPGLWSALPAAPNDVRLFDTTPLRETLLRLIDFDYLNQGSVRLIATAVDIESGEDVVFDNRQQVLQVDHIMASAAMPVAFPPVTVAGRTLVDAGVSCNLPLRALFSELPEEDVTCLCFDMAPQSGGIPASLEGTLARSLDLLFACQSKHAIHDLQVRHSREPGDASAIRLIHVCYTGDGREVALKAFDYSQRSVERRLESGHRDATLVLNALPGLPRAKGGAFETWRLTKAGLVNDC
ncbi:patatin-like phospholipase family protein [Sinorhizobium kostiense]|uniref:patatin-like phospholipase family protein n=1 Tax=Sinorhizobium kostiense TaxID=76747 RepID=UPI001AE2579E|nr:patatin-like phospholipase family protein [Sinorhizobium kostiense]